MKRKRGTVRAARAASLMASGRGDEDEPGEEEAVRRNRKRNLPPNHRHPTESAS